MAMLSSVARATPDVYLPYTLAVLLEAEGIENMHVQLLLQDQQVMQALHYLDQLRRDISANPTGDMATMAHRVQQAQYMLSRCIHGAWLGYPVQQQQLQNPHILLALIDGLRCTQP